MSNYYHKYVKVHGHDEINNIKVRVAYDLGGRNIMSGNQVDRGIYLYVMPVELEEQKSVSGYVTTVEKTMPFTWKGYKKLLKPLKRKSDKTGRTLAKLVADEVINKHGEAWLMVKHVMALNGLSFT